MRRDTNTVDKEIADEFDSLACDFCDSYKESGLTKSSKILLGYLDKEGLAGKTILDLGCGTGSFSIEALKAGAAHCVGVDLSPQMIRNANELAAKSGFSEKARFAVGDAAALQHPVSDAVVLDKVICCYPDVDALLKSASESSSKMLGFVVPRDEGIVKGPLRLGVGLFNLVEKLRKRKAPMYLHSLKKINGLLEGSGFVQKRKTGSGFWLVFLCARAGV
jgi:magnesium-protoporphyrin O-methyltransferase